MVAVSSWRLDSASSSKTKGSACRDSKTAIVTGASGGIGAALVEGFLEQGYNVVATSRHASQKLTASSRVVLVDGDIANQQTAQSAVEAAISSFGAIDVLVNNAGIFLTRPFIEFTSRRVQCSCLHESARILLDHSAHRKRDVEAEIGVRHQHQRGACRSANSWREWFNFDDDEGWVERRNRESRGRIRQ